MFTRTPTEKLADLNLRQVPQALRFWALRTCFGFWQRLGIHVTPNHFYWPIPDTRFLKEELWTKRSKMPGVEINDEKQINLLREFVEKFKSEYDRFPRRPTGVPHQYYLDNRGFVSVDGEVLYCMIRYFKPRRIFEIGSGNSTRLSAQAILRNREEDGHDCTLIAFDPYPDSLLRTGFPGLSECITTRIEDVPLSRFTELEPNDILFIDSSHVLRIGGDVYYEYLEILPSLNVGVLVHLHDIFLPMEYPKEWVLGKKWFWNEQYVLQAFLAFNRSFEVLWAASYMHLQHPEKLERAFQSYDRSRVWPGSFWIKRVA